MLGRSLPVLTWLSFEVGSAGAVYVGALACTSRLLAACPLAFASGLCAPCSASPLMWPCNQPSWRRCAAGGAEPPLTVKLKAAAIHAASVAIVLTELRLNDLPVLWQHMPLAVLLGCGFALNILCWRFHHGRFTYLYADAARTSAPAALIACTLTPLALALAYAAVASISASTRVRGEAS